MILYVLFCLIFTFTVQLEEPRGGKEVCKNPKVIFLKPFIFIYNISKHKYSGREGGRFLRGMFQIYLHQEGKEMEVDWEPRQWQMLLLRGGSLSPWAGGSQALDHRQILPGIKLEHHLHCHYVNPQVSLVCSDGLTIQVDVKDLCQTEAGGQNEKLIAEIAERVLNISIKIEQTDSKVEDVKSMIQDCCCNNTTEGPV